METIEAKGQINEIVQQVQGASFTERKSNNIYNEDSINEILDAISETKRNLKRRTDFYNEIIPRFEKITWFTNLDEDSLKLLNELIALSRDLHHREIIAYVILNNALHKKGILKYDLKEYKASLDDFKETYEDVECVFFVLPQNREFCEITNQLSNIK